MAEHHHEPGTMDVTSQERAFDGFVKILTRTGIFVAVLLIFLALVNG